MKKIVALSLFLFILAFACCKKTPQPEKTLPSVIYITGTVTDKQTKLPLDSVEITLRYNTTIIMGMPIPMMTYTTGNDGKFNFQFSPREDVYYYSLDFYKAGYKETGISVDKYKEHQEFNVALEK